MTVDYATTDGTAKAGEDYTATSGTLTFAPGETEKTVSVTIIDDTIEDSGETFRLVLSDPSGGQLGDTEATGTIFNTDPPSTPTSVSEPAGEDLPADTTTTGVIAVNSRLSGAYAHNGTYTLSVTEVTDAMWNDIAPGGGGNRRRGGGDALILTDGILCGTPCSRDRTALMIGSPQ